MGASLEVFCFKADEFVDLFVLVGECAHLFGELLGTTSVIDFDVASEGLELVDVFRAVVSLNRKQFHVKCLLVPFLQEGHKERTCFKHARFQHRVEESLVVILPPQKLLRRQPIVLFPR